MTRDNTLINSSPFFISSYVYLLAVLLTLLSIFIGSILYIQINDNHEITIKTHDFHLDSISNTTNILRTIDNFILDFPDNSPPLVTDKYNNPDIQYNSDNLKIGLREYYINLQKKHLQYPDNDFTPLLKTLGNLIIYPEHNVVDSNKTSSIISSNNLNIEAIKRTFHQIQRLHKQKLAKYDNSHNGNETYLQPIFIFTIIVFLFGSALLTKTIIFRTDKIIAEKTNSNKLLQESENRFRSTFEQAAVGIAHIGIDGRWLLVNERLCNIVGYERSELLNLKFQDITHPDDLAEYLDLMNELLSGQRDHYAIEKRYLCKDGNTIWIQLTESLVRDSKNNPEYFIKVIEDINNRKAAEAHIHAALTEKNIVLRELHHRVKNNMQVISSLLSLQARYSKRMDPERAFQESRERIRAMALIHERLYGSIDLVSVDFLDYIRYLGERMARLYNKPGVIHKIQVDGISLRLPVDQALPCALICNELITNAIQHAYPAEQRERLIEIHITNTNQDLIQLEVRDYGCGIDSKKLSEEPETLGLIIIKALARQLVADIHFEISQGTIVKLIFPVHLARNSFIKPVNNAFATMQ